jgi:hypothetical protein
MDADNNCGRSDNEPVLRPRHRSLAVGALIAISVAAAGASIAAGVRPRSAAVSSQVAAGGHASPVLPAGFNRLRLTDGAVLPYPASWRAVRGDPGSASAALLGAGGTIRAYLNATPADGRETLAGWARFRVRHNAAEGDRDVRLISARTGVRLDAGRASCVVDEYVTSRSRYRELACILAPANRGHATVLIAAAQPNAWARERPLLQFAIHHFTS